MKLVHGEQDIRLLRPLAPSGTLIARNRVVSLTDKGAGKGAIAVLLRTLIDEATRRDGGRKPERRLSCAATAASAQTSGVSDPGPEPLPAVPERAADIEVSYATRPEAALDLPPERRREPAACRSRYRREGRLRPARSCTACAPTAWARAR